ncbi:MAG: preprotein translocase subunit SecE [Myxococcales bacterium]|nr:preprotein translocase subunit SecE [Myxococcales bacterium]
MSVGVLGGIALWRDQRVFNLAHEVAGELRKVTWPSFAETRLSTVVVMVTTVLVAVLLALFDFGFRLLTKAIYGI